MMTTTIVFLAAITVLAQGTPEKAQIVAVTGCLKEAGTNNWIVTNATDPAPSRAGASVTPPTGPLSGKNEFKLIGVAEFNLPAQKDRTVVVKGMLIKASPVSRLNITSVRAVAPACASRE
ncbi:MAG: hypothetical protein HY646_12955 [Acidobacteria bacterium]|nr:hypothetical protein [Acidobacteriota bacterium]